MKRTALAIVLVLAALGVQGCASTGAPAMTPTATAAAAIAPVVQTSGRTVLLLDAAQIATLTGAPLTMNSVDQAMVALVKPRTWAAQPATEKYAALIARAFMQQQGVAYGAVNATSRDADARVEVIVLHTPQHLSVDVERGTAGG